MSVEECPFFPPFAAFQFGKRNSALHLVVMWMFWGHSDLKYSIFPYDQTMLLFFILKEIVIVHINDVESSLSFISEGELGILLFGFKMISFPFSSR